MVLSNTPILQKGHYQVGRGTLGRNENVGSPTPREFEFVSKSLRG